MSHLGQLVSWPEVGSWTMTQKPELQAPALTHCALCACLSGRRVGPVGFPCAVLKDSQEHKRGAPAFTRKRTQSYIWAWQTKAERNCHFQHHCFYTVHRQKPSLGLHRRLGLGASSGRPQQQGQEGNKSCLNRSGKGCPPEYTAMDSAHQALGAYYIPVPDGTCRHFLKRQDYGEGGDFET